VICDLAGKCIDYPAFGHGIHLRRSKGLYSVLTIQ
jgi:hypothetical protein